MWSRAPRPTVRGAWLGFLTVLKSSDNTMWVEPWASGDEGRTWVQLGTSSWLPLGTSGAWDDKVILQVSHVTLNTGEEIYFYTGGAEDHATFPRTSEVGVAAVAAGKLVALTGTGTLTTPDGATGGMVFRLTANGSGGSVTAAVLDSGGSVISGFNDADMSAITTDVASKIISWGGVSQLPANADKVRVTITSATLHQWAVGY